MNKETTLPFFTRSGSHKLTINTITLGAFRKLPFVMKDDLSAAEQFKQFKAMILACTDLTPTEFEELSVPDFTQLHQDIRAFILTPSDEMNDHSLTGKDFEFDLAFPFTNELEETISHIKFAVPKVKHSEALADIDDHYDREEFMFRVVCHLDKQDMDAMALNDYLAIKPQVGAFFQLAGDYFRPVTSKL
ncbi:phage tail assembly protein [Photobacterium carnosum]|uniref:phage tail assembly protein n=1 Tax=Photobacterium carnosum TaxID=2023717 RepID=UPI001E53E340|nr:phage tail assembly protein [Photobacterium carnosum]MCD9516995.1 phage tail assembly protein [Photobacterium carnosum]MCD9554548.1 phage tail assembly protein [Photobacterium carnosum]